MNLLAAQAATLALDKVWPLVDPAKRSFRQASTDAGARAYSKAWTSDARGYADARAFAISTSLYASILKGRSQADPYSDRWASAFARTLRIIAERSGYKDESPETLQKNAKGTGSIEIIIAILIGLLILALAAVTIWWVTKAAEVVDRDLSRRSDSRDLVSTQEQAKQIVDAHFEREKQLGHEIPWSEGELKALEMLERVQKGILEEKKEREEKGIEQPSVWPVLALLGAAAGGVWYFYLRKAAA
jgi:hypothetical protein